MLFSGRACILPFASAVAPALYSADRRRSRAARGRRASSEKRALPQLGEEDADHDLRQINGLLRARNVTQAAFTPLLGCAGDCRNRRFVRSARVNYSVVIAKAWKVGAQMQGLVQRTPGITLMKH
jgi:hypothetical protein